MIDRVYTGHLPLAFVVVLVSQKGGLRAVVGLTPNLDEAVRLKNSASKRNVRDRVLILPVPTTHLWGDADSDFLCSILLNQRDIIAGKDVPIIAVVAVDTEDGTRPDYSRN